MVILKEHDSRLERRWKRRDVSNQGFKQILGKQQALKETQKCQSYSDDNEDPQYKLFMQNMVEFEDHFAFVNPNDNGEPEVIKYDVNSEGDISNKEYEAEANKKGKKLEHKCVDDEADEDYLKIICCLDGATSGKSSTELSSDGDINSECNVSEKEFEDDNGSDEGEGSEFDDDDNEDYLAFLALLKTEGGDKLYGDGNSESASDSDLVVLDENPFADREKTKIIDMEAYSPTEDLNEKNSEFKTDLIEVLKMPYNSKEHKELDREVRARKPITVERNLRGKSKPYPSATKLGKSLLANFDDFAKVYKLAEDDKYESLSLLRGLKFWLTYIARDGAFQPWNYPSLLQVMPRQ